MVRAVFPGTFDPIHYGHIDIARRASKLFDELVIAVYDRPLKNLLFSPEERLEYVRKSFADDKKIRITGYSGLTVDFCKKIDAQVIVRGLRVFSDFEHEFRMALANHRLVPECGSDGFDHFRAAYISFFHNCTGDRLSWRRYFKYGSGTCPSGNEKKI